MLHSAVIQSTPMSVVQGRTWHRENIEEMARDVIDCLGGVKFGDEYLAVFRGLKQEQWVFNDYSTLREFLSLSEANKELFDLRYLVEQ